MRTVGAYQSGWQGAFWWGPRPLSLAVVDTCRCITGPKGEAMEAGVASLLFKKRSEEQEEYYNFEMIIALSACVGVSIRVSWCKRHRLVGKWWFCMAAWLRPGTVSQQFPECSVVLVCGSGCLDSHHTLMCVCRTVCLLSSWGASMFNSKRDFFFFTQEREHFSELHFKAWMSDSWIMHPSV